MRQTNMQTTTNAQMGLLDSLMIATPTNEFLERLEGTLEWKPIEKALQAMYPATTERPPCAPLARSGASLRKCLAGGNGAQATGGCGMWDTNATAWNWSSRASVGT
jgi:hypothetical protein